MQNIDSLTNLFKKAIKNSIEAGLLNIDEASVDPGLERPRDESNGDFASTIALRLAKQAKMNPRQIAQLIVDNFPENDEMKGVKICRQARGQWKNEWEKTTRQNGQVHYWLTGYYEPDDSNDKTTDKWALANGFVAITPTTIDLTSYSTMQFVEQLVTL